MANPTVEFHPDAAVEVVAAREWYEARSPSAAKAFAGEFDRAMATIVEAPHRWPKDKHGLHRYLLHRFPFSIVYRMEDRGIRVIAVAHGHRRPRYWQFRE